MRYLLEAIFQGIFIFIMTILVPIIYSSIELGCCLLFLQFMRVVKNKGNIRSLCKEYSRGLLLRAAALLMVSIILSLISIINYNRIISNPEHISSIYVDEMDAIFADINNRENGIYNIFGQLVIYGIPSTSVLSIIMIILNNIGEVSKFRKISFYILMTLSGAFLALGAYNLANAMMGI
ncbi:MAG: hypothetical protein Q8936_21565 [Bacillota bacterium]|nr:hypothetical protein [Bacillota bacterium]